MCQDARIKMVRALRRSRDNKTPITNLLGLAATIACRLIYEEVRRAAPEYCMKRDVRHLVTQSPLKTLLARWQIAQAWLIGFTRWQGQPFEETPRYAAFRDDDTPFVQQQLQGRNPASGQVKLPELVVKLLDWVQTPLNEPNLVEHLLSLQAKKPRALISLQKLAEDGNEPRTLAPEERQPRRDWQAWWQAIRELPVTELAAFLLAMEPEDLMVLTAQANPCDDIASALNMNPDTMARLWPNLPLPDTEIAALYGTTVNNIYQRRHRFMNRLRRIDEPPLL